MSAIPSHNFWYCPNCGEPVILSDKDSARCFCKMMVFKGQECPNTLDDNHFGHATGDCPGCHYHGLTKLITPRRVETEDATKVQIQ